MTAEAAVLFVCLGNICRSPTAQAVFAKMAEEAGLSALDIDSAGTSGWHKGEPPDRRSREAGMERGYSFEGQMVDMVEAASRGLIAHIQARQNEDSQPSSG